MSRRSRKHRKRFACGHRGYGQFCHRCADQQRQQVKQLHEREQACLLKQLAQWEWQQSFLADPIDLTQLPKKIVLKAREVLTALNDGQNLAQLHGKRFHFDRNLIRIPVSYRYRLLCCQKDSKIVPLRVLTHEAYNAVARNTGSWVKRAGRMARSVIAG